MLTPGMYSTVVTHFILQQQLYRQVNSKRCSLNRFASLWDISRSVMAGVAVVGSLWTEAMQQRTYTWIRANGRRSPLS